MLDNGTDATPQTCDQWNLLAFPIETYRARLASVQSDLNDKGLAGCLLFDPENIYWLTGYQTIGYFTFQALSVSVPVCQPRSGVGPSHDRRCRGDYGYG